jgi:hypothetical protein
MKRQGAWWWQALNLLTNHARHGCKTPTKSPDPNGMPFFKSSPFIAHGIELSSFLAHGSTETG